MTVTMEVLPRFPARVDEGPGIAVDRANGVYTIGADIGGVIPVTAPTDPANTWVLVQMPDGSYARVPLSSVASSGNMAWLNVKDFGATGGGTLDDTVAFQAAMDAAGVNGGTVFVPSGSYRISAPVLISSNTTVQGEPGALIIVDAALPLTAAVFLNKHSTGASGLTTSEVRIDQNILVTGLTFDGAARIYPIDVILNGYIIEFNACTNVRVEQCTFQNHGAMVILIAGCMLSGTQNNYIINCGRKAFSTHGINLLQYGNLRYISSIATGNPTVLTVQAGPPPSMTTGNTVRIAGVQGVSGLIPDGSYAVVASDATTISIAIDSTGATPFIMSGSAQVTNIPYWHSWWTWSINDRGQDNKRGLLQVAGDWVHIAGAKSFGSREGGIYVSAGRHVVIDGAQLNRSVFDDIVSDLVEINYGVDVTISNCQFVQSDFAPLGVVGCIGLKIISCWIENGGAGNPCGISLINQGYFPVQDFEISGCSFVDRRAAPLMLSGINLTKSGGVNNQIVNGRIHDCNFMQLGVRNHVTGITNTSPAVLTTPFAHKLISGQSVYVRGALQPASINGGPYVITVISPTTFSIPIDTSADGAFIGSRVYAGTVDPALSITEVNASTGDGVRYSNNLGIPFGALGSTDEIVGAALVGNVMTGGFSLTPANYQSAAFPGYATAVRSRITNSENHRISNRQSGGLTLERPAADFLTVEAEWVISPLSGGNLWIKRNVGAGTLQFGVHTASADAPVTGYITIADQNGTVRKLAVVA